MKKNLLIVIAAIIIPVIFVGLRRNSAPFFSVEKYQCVQDVMLSHDYFSSINSTVVDLCNKHCAAHVIIDQLQQQFPVLKKITIAYKPTATCVTLSAHEPMCCINDGLVLTAHKEIFPKQVFADDALKDILHLEVAQSLIQESECARGYPFAPISTSFQSGSPSKGTEDGVKRAPDDHVRSVSCLIANLLQKLPHNISEVYNIELIKEHCVRFIDKQQPQFMIISSIAQEKLAQLSMQCREVKRAINEKNGFDKGAQWVADTRFAHYIVAYKA